MCLEWVWLFTRWYAEIVNQSAFCDDTRRDAPLRHVRQASYCEPGFMDVMRAMSVMLVMRAMRVVRVMRVLPLLRVVDVMRAMSVMRVMRVYPYESRTSLRCFTGRK